MNFQIFILITLVITSFLIGSEAIAGEGSGGGGSKGRLLSSNGGIGGGPRLTIEQVNKIDNVEVDNEIRFPKTFKEKCLLLADPKIQTIQFDNGEIITISRILGEGGSSGGPHKILN